VIVDNFALSMFQSCPTKYEMRMRRHWTPRRKSAALGFGGAFHEGLAAWYKTNDAGAALQAIAKAWPDSHPTDDYRNKQRCLDTMIQYIKHYPKESFGVVGAPDNPMIEKSFTLDTGMTLDNGEPIEYGGIMDGLISFNNKLYVLEHKTTSRLGSTYFYQFRPNNQITGYVWAGGEMSGQPVGGAIINAICVLKNETKFAREPTSRADDEIAEWMIHVRETCQIIHNCKESGIWPRFTPSCMMYGRCDYHSVCVLPHKSEREKMLEQDYVLDPWSFEDRDDTAET